MTVVATRHSGIPELVIHGESGLLAAEADADGLARAMVRLSGDAALRDRLGRNARAAVGAGFDLRKLNVRLLRLFEELSIDAGHLVLEATGVYDAFARPPDIPTGGGHASPGGRFNGGG